MGKTTKQPRDANQLAKFIVDAATQIAPPPKKKVVAKKAAVKVRRR